MNKEQQELYEKLLKKVNEYCLGAAAEDVIAAIDALVDTYETKVASYDYLLRGVTYYFESETFTLADLSSKLKALEVLKECFDFEGFDEFIPNGKWFEKDIQEREKLLKEMTK